MIAWLADEHVPPGGAEFTQAEFLAAAPEGVEVTQVSPSRLDLLADCERAVVHNCVTYPPETAEALKGRPVIRYHNDLSPHASPELRAWLDANATHIFCSPLQRRRYGLDGALIPPALDLQSFRPNRQTKRNGVRAGTCSIAAWQNPGKGAQLLAEYALEHGPVDVYGDGPFVPHGENLNHCGALAPEKVAQVLWSYERMVFLPTAVEPFGRCVVEAHLAGCGVVTNDLVGARHWLEQEPGGLETAAADFWSVVLS